MEKKEGGRERKGREGKGKGGREGRKKGRERGRGERMGQSGQKDKGGERIRGS